MLATNKIVAIVLFYKFDNSGNLYGGLGRHRTYSGTRAKRKTVNFYTGDEVCLFYVEENIMTRYEELIIKSDRCMQCAINTTGRMRAIWRKHAEALKQMANSLTVEQAREIVK